jgi:hypothetical protein
MDAKTLKALKASIAKWERNVAAETPRDALTGSDDCPLCALFFRSNCNGCPVEDRTGKPVCRDTPYEFADRMLWQWEYFDGSRERWQSAAQAEVDFLKSLLPEGSAS